MNWSNILIISFCFATPALAIALKLFGKINLAPALLPLAPALISTAFLLVYLMAANTVDGIAMAIGIGSCGLLWILSLPVAWFMMARSYKKLQKQRVGGPHFSFSKGTPANAIQKQE